MKQLKDYLEENTIYKSASDYSNLVKNKTEVAIIFVGDFLGICAMYGADPSKSVLKDYLRSEKRVRLQNIGDDNNDVSIAVKLATDAKLIREQEAKQMTRFLFKLKHQQIKILDLAQVKSMLSQGSLKKIEQALNSRWKIEFTKYSAGQIDLYTMMSNLSRSINSNNVMGDEVKDLYRKYRPILKAKAKETASEKGESNDKIDAVEIHQQHDDGTTSTDVVDIDGDVTPIASKAEQAQQKQDTLTPASQNDFDLTNQQNVIEQFVKMLESDKDPKEYCKSIGTTLSKFPFNMLEMDDPNVCLTYFEHPDVLEDKYIAKMSQSSIGSYDGAKKNKHRYLYLLGLIEKSSQSTGALNYLKLLIENKDKLFYSDGKSLISVSLMLQMPAIQKNIFSSMSDKDLAMFILNGSMLLDPDKVSLSLDNDIHGLVSASNILIGQMSTMDSDQLVFFIKYLLSNGPDIVRYSFMKMVEVFHDLARDHGNDAEVLLKDTNALKYKSIPLNPKFVEAYIELKKNSFYGNSFLKNLLDLDLDIDLPDSPKEIVEQSYDQFPLTRYNEDQLIKLFNAIAKLGAYEEFVANCVSFDKLHKQVKTNKNPSIQDASPYQIKGIKGLLRGLNLDESKLDQPGFYITLSTYADLWVTKQLPEFFYGTLNVDNKTIEWMDEYIKWLSDTSSSLRTLYAKEINEEQKMLFNITVDLDFLKLVKTKTTLGNENWLKVVTPDIKALFDIEVNIDSDVLLKNIFNNKGLVLGGLFYQKDEIGLQTVFKLVDYFGEGGSIAIRDLDTELESSTASNLKKVFADFISEYISELKKKDFELAKTKINQFTSIGMLRGSRLEYLLGEITDKKLSDNIYDLIKYRYSGSKNYSALSNTIIAFHNSGKLTTQETKSEITSILDEQSDYKTIFLSLSSNLGKKLSSGEDISSALELMEPFKNIDSENNPLNGSDFMSLGGFLKEQFEDRNISSEKIDELCSGIIDHQLSDQGGLSEKFKDIISRYDSRLSEVLAQMGSLSDSQNEQVRQAVYDATKAFVSDVNEDDIDENVKLFIAKVSGVGNLDDIMEPLGSNTLKHDITLSCIESRLFESGDNSISNKLYDSNQNSVVPLVNMDHTQLAFVLKKNDIQLFDQTKTPIEDGESYQQYVNRAVETSQKSIDSKLGKVQAESVEQDSDQLEQMTIEYNSMYNSGMHGNVALEIQEVLEPGDTLTHNKNYSAFIDQHPDTEIVEPAFHGTGSVAASMILRDGFKVISGSDDTMAVGRALGDGIYFTDVLDKSAQYVGDMGFSRKTGTVGYLFEMTGALGKEGQDYGYAGTSRFVSEEWCVFDPGSQLQFKRIFKVRIITRDQLDEMKQNQNLIESFTQLSHFANWVLNNKQLTEDTNTEKDYKYCTSFVFNDGMIPLSSGSVVTQSQAFSVGMGSDHYAYETSKYGGVITVRYNDPETFDNLAYVINNTEQWLKTDLGKRFLEYIDSSNHQ